MLDVLLLPKLGLVAWLAYASVRGRAKYRQLADTVAHDGEPAQQRYLSASGRRKLIQMLLVLLLLFLSRAMGQAPLPFEFAHASFLSTAVWCAACFGITVASVILFRYFGDRQLRFLLRSVGAILPRSAHARRRFIVFSGIAGLTEEIIFRWFLTDLFMSVPGVEFWPALAASSVCFGLAHYYQGALNVVLTGLVGYVLGTIWVDSGSLLVSIVMHFLIDARIAFVLTDARLAALEAN